MESMRQQKMGRQVQKELSDIFLKYGRDYFNNQMVTITQVKMSPDMGLAKVYLSVFPNESADKLFENLDHKKSEIRKHLGNRIGKRTRVIPEIAFFHDEVEEYASKMDKLISNLHIPPAKDSE
jgi:ribosome-binding factor A